MGANETSNVTLQTWDGLDWRPKDKVIGHDVIARVRYLTTKAWTT